MHASSFFILIQRIDYDNLFTGVESEQQGFGLVLITCQNMWLDLNFYRKNISTPFSQLFAWQLLMHLFFCLNLARVKWYFRASWMHKERVKELSTKFISVNWRKLMLSRREHCMMSGSSGAKNILSTTNTTIHTTHATRDGENNAASVCRLQVCHTQTIARHVPTAAVSVWIDTHQLYVTSQRVLALSRSQ